MVFYLLDFKNDAACLEADNEEGLLALLINLKIAMVPHFWQLYGLYG